MATAAKTSLQTSMRALTLFFDPKDKRAVKFVEMLKLMDFFKVEDSPYDPEYVAEIKAMDRNTFKAVKREDTNVNIIDAVCRIYQSEMYRQLE